MQRILPAKFGRREWLLTLFAVALAIPSGCLTWAAGMGGGGAWMLFTIIGTVIFVAVAGSDRCFFTALFTLMLTVGLVVSVVIDRIFLRHESWRTQDSFILMATFGAFVVLPVAFAWLVNLMVRYANRAAANDGGRR